MADPNLSASSSAAGTGEFAAIERLRRRWPGPPAGEIWIGDDAAVVRSPGDPLLLTVDTVVAGVHGDLTRSTLADFGYRALAAAVSDIAAMGGRPAHALVSVAGPPATDLDALAEGIGEAAADHGCDLVGGDLSNAPELVVTVAVTGAVPDGAPVLRSGARPGDTLYVTGPLGAAAAGLRHLRRDPSDVTSSTPGPAEFEALVERHRRPRARLREGEVARRAGASAMIDVSDGLGADVGHLADASGVGVELWQLPVAAGATDEEALGGGDDYELVIAVADGSALVDAFAATGLGLPLELGRCVEDSARRSLLGRSLDTTGYEHGWLRRR